MNAAGQPSPAERPFWRRWWPRRDPDRRRRQDAATILYATIVKKSRTPAFFVSLGIPDTTEGRFEVLALHAALVMRRLKAEGAAGRALAQDLFDLMFADVDVNLRELGVGDLSVGKYVKRFARQFYARIEALDLALAAGERGPLARFLEDNVWRGGGGPTPGQPRRLVDYLFDLADALDHVPAASLLAGRIDPAALPVPGAPAS